MPELPEVESLRHLLTHRLLHARILDSRFPSPVILRGTNAEHFAAQTTGKTISSLTRRGKYLLFGLADTERLDAASGKKEAGIAKSSGISAVIEDEELRLIVHLRMRGGLRVEDEERIPGKYLCGLLSLDSGRELRYYDMWRWGEWWLAPPAPQPTGIAGLDALGVEPFSEDFTAQFLYRALSERRGPIKPLLLSQRIVAGLGNIYCDESLHRARIHPARRASEVGFEESQRLYAAIVGVLGEAIAQGRAFADELAAHNGNLEQFEGIYTPQVYDRPGQPCTHCGQELTKITFHGRGTTFCPQCQPAVASA